MRINLFLENELNGVIAGFSIKKDKADIFLSSRFKKNRLGKRDREWIRERFFFYIRHKLLFDKLDTNGVSTARTIAMIFDNEPDDELLIKISELKNNGLYDLLFNQSFSEFLVEKIFAQFGENAFGWFNSKAETVIRTNLLKISRKELAIKLGKEGYVSDITDMSPAGIVITSNTSSLKNSHLFDEGLFEFQDESSQISTLLINRSSATLFDFCSGGGGKSLAAGSFFKGLKITASDIRSHVFEEIFTRSKRAGLKIFTKKHNEIKQLFDTVFVDAPCSGSGVLRRNPADRWIIEKKMIDELNRTQLKILDNAKHFVRSGGELIYVTCSFLKDENELIIEEFLKNSKDFSLISADVRFRENISEDIDPDQIVSGSFFRTAPGFQRDIMFGAIMRKN